MSRPTLTPASRTELLDRLEAETFDLVVVGVGSRGPASPVTPRPGVFGWWWSRRTISPRARRRAARS
ncbi:MAG: hypothetical protein R2695_15055 [Acidimicrobiales bacterium]